MTEAEFNIQQQAAYLSRCRSRFEDVKAFAIKHGCWDKAKNNPHEFNRLWCKFLGQPESTKPPPSAMRR